MENFYFYINYINQNLESYYLIFFIVYFFSLIIFFSLSLPGGPILAIASGFFFGFYIGFLINIFSLLIGSYVFVYVAKIALKKIFNKLFLKYSDKISNLIKRSSYEYLVIFRLIQGNPLFIQNLTISFLNISKTKFIISSFIGFSPLIIIYSYFGSKLLEIYELKDITYSDIISKDFIIFITVIIIFLIIRIIFNSKKK